MIQIKNSHPQNRNLLVNVISSEVMFGRAFSMRKHRQAFGYATLICRYKQETRPEKVCRGD